MSFKWGWGKGGFRLRAIYKIHSILSAYRYYYKNCGELLKIVSFFVTELEKLRSFDFFGFIRDSHSSLIVHITTFSDSDSNTGKYKIYANR